MFFHLTYFCTQVKWSNFLHKGGGAQINTIRRRRQCFDRMHAPFWFATSWPPSAFSHCYIMITSEAWPVVLLQKRLECQELKTTKQTSCLVQENRHILSKKSQLFNVIFSQNSHFQNLTFHNIYIFKVSFFTKFTFFKHQILGNFWIKS